MSGSEERRLDPAVVMMGHEGWHQCRGGGQLVCDCLPFRLAQAWAQEYQQHTHVLERNNTLASEVGDLQDAYAALEAQYLALTDAHAGLVDKLAALAKEAGR